MAGQVNENIGAVGIAGAGISFGAITIQQILVFIQVVERGGFSKASGALNMSQSAVSKSIARMEQELGIILFNRTTREIHLTEAGEFLYREWKDQVKSMQDSYIRALSVQDRENRVLRIGILNTANPELFFWDIRERFTRRYPETELDLASEYMTDLEAALAAGKYDLILVPDFERFSLEETGMCWKWAARSHAVVIMNKNHHLASHLSLKMEEIFGEKFVTLEQTGGQNHLMDLVERMNRYHVRPNVVAGYRNAYDIRYLFRNQTDALLFVDEYFDCPDDPELVKVPLEDQTNGIICGWNPNNSNPQVQKFLETLRV